jgi:hypothetical protein
VAWPNGNSPEVSSLCKSRVYHVGFNQDITKHLACTCGFIPSTDYQEIDGKFT